MTLLAITFPEINPVAFELGPLLGIGPFAVKWYGLAYMAGLVLGWLYIRRLLSDTAAVERRHGRRSRSTRTDDLLLFMTIGVVLGGRLGFVLFYEPGHYLAHPLEIPAVWKGGMAFHGALLGCGARDLAVRALERRLAAGARWICARPRCRSACCSAGIANFINGELFGRPTDVPWGMVFPEARMLYPAVEPTPRHPSQLYEACFEGLVLFLVLRLLTHNRGALQTPGLVTGMFLIGYGLGALVLRAVPPAAFRPCLQRRAADRRHRLLDPDDPARPVVHPARARRGRRRAM